MSAPAPPATSGAAATPGTNRRRLYVFCGALALVAVLVASGYLAYEDPAAPHVRGRLTAADVLGPMLARSS